MPQPTQRHQRDLFDWIALISTVVGVAIVATATVIAAWQAMLTREQAFAANGAQRAWIKLEMTPIEGMSPYPGTTNFGFDILATNVGNIPARFVIAHISSKERFFDWNVEGTFTEDGGNCETPERNMNGMTIFPGETRSIAQRAIKSPSRYKINTETGRSYFAYQISVCVQYVANYQEFTNLTGTIFTLVPRKKVGHPVSTNGYVSGLSIERYDFSGPLAGEVAY